MIIEMKPAEALKEWEAGTLTMVLVDGEIMDVPQFLEGVRWLVDLEDAEVQVEDKTEEKPIRKPHAPKNRKPRRTRAEIEKEREDILRVWNGGEHNIEEVVEILGLPKATVKKILPETVNG